jgi:hypothetical protein
VMNPRRLTLWMGSGPGGEGMVGPFTSANLVSWILCLRSYAGTGPQGISVTVQGRVSNIRRHIY